MEGMLILQFLVLTGVVSGIIIFFLHRTLIASTDGAVKRLNNETEVARNKQKELSEKIKQADEELTKRKKESEELIRKMAEEAEEKAKQERSKIVSKARQEAEEIISKAQSTKDKIRKALEKEMELKTVDFASEILCHVISGKGREALHRQLIIDFLENLEKMEMDHIGPEIDTIEIVTAYAVDASTKEKIASIIKEKLQREVKINTVEDSAIVGGVVLKFGSLVLDGSIQNYIKETAIALKQKKEEE